MKILVQKFGGTSVALQEARIAVKDKVQKAVRSGFAPVVVVSAMGRKGEPYATDTLIKVLKETNLSVNVRELDMMMCCGEIMAACVMAATLQKFGINAMAVRPGLLRILSLVRHGSKISMSAICIIYWNQALFLLSAGFRA
jgi:aspartate kinase